MKKIFNIAICFVLIIFIITGCSEQKAEQNKYGHFEKAAELNQPRYDHTATLLPDGNVLIAGGNIPGEFGILDSAEIYLTKENKFVMTGKMYEARANHLAVLLKNGKVLLIGGQAKGYDGKTGTVEEYNPQTGQFKLVGHLLSKRFDPQGVLLDDGRVFVYGGCGPEKTGHAEIYDPVANKSKYSAQMNLSRFDFALTKLKDGKVLIIGGSGSDSLTEGKLEKKIMQMPLNERKKYALSAELYDPKADSFKLILGLNKYRNANLAGGTDYDFKDKKIVQIPEVEMYNPNTNKFYIIGKLKYPSINPRLCLIKNKYVLIITISRDKQALFDIKNEKFEETDSLRYPRTKFTATTLDNQDILIVGGVSDYNCQKAEIFKLNNKGEGK